MNFKDKVAIVTGSSKGIGAATVRDLASKGCNVVINYLTDEYSALKLKEEVLSFGVKALLIKCDVSNEAEVIDMRDTVLKEFGKIDILVSNAGISKDNKLKDKTALEFRRVLDVNLVGTFLVNKYIGQVMHDQKYGKIVNISSTNGIDTNYPLSMDYDASKAGVISLTHNFAELYAPYVNVNSVAPGWTNTFDEDGIAPDLKEQELKKIMMGRFADSSEIANVVSFLCGDESKYITNEIIRVDGGVK